MINHEGNVSGDANVNLIDLQAVKGQLFLAVGAGNFKNDIGCNNSINLLDLQAVKGNLFLPAGACP